MNDLLIVWNDLDNIGIPIVDEQHRSLIATINSLSYLLQTEHCQIALQASVNRFREYMIIHALTEEGIMERVGYPNLEEHKELHASLTARSMSAGYRTLHMHDDPVKVLDIVKDWWLTHIREEDRAYAPYVADYRRKRTLR